MRRIKLDETGGFPFEQEALAFLQLGYTEALVAIAACYGNKVILGGMNLAAGVISDGWFIYNGEIIKFNQSAANTYVAITEDATGVEFEDGLVKDVYFNKTAECGFSGAFLFSELVRASSFTEAEKATLDSTWITGDIKMISCDNAYIATNFDSTGLGRLARAGWARCNGQNGTCDMSGRVPVGYDSNTIEPNNNVWDVAYNTMGATIGGKTNEIEKENLPAVGIDVPIPKEETSVGESGSGFITMGGGGNEPVDGPTLVTADLGDGTPLSIIQPSIVTLFIQKI